MTGERRGLFLDLDGTLADSLTMLRSVYFQFLDRFGIEGTDEEFEALNGPPLRLIIALLQKRYRIPGSVETLYMDYLACVAQAHSLVAPAVGAARVLSKAKECGWFVAVVTSSPRKETSLWLERNDLAFWIDTIVGGDEVCRGKPAPEPYRLAVERGQCRREISLAVEDSLQGGMAAIAAGIPTWFLKSIPPALQTSPYMRGCLPDFASLSKLL